MTSDDVDQVRVRGGLEERQEHDEPSGPGTQGRPAVTGVARRISGDSLAHSHQ